MIPYTPHGQSSASGVPIPRKGQSSTDQVDHEKVSRQRLQLQNRLRIIKNDIVDKQRTLHDIERDIRTLHMHIDHIVEEIGRVGGEYHRLTEDVKGVERGAKVSDAGFHEKEQELRRKEDEEQRYAKEIDALKAQIAEKERVIGQVRQEVSKLMKEKEDFRRIHELDYFTARTGAGHAEEKRVRLELLKQEQKRKETEIAQKERALTELKHIMNEKSQDVLGLEAELRHLGS